MEGAASISIKAQERYRLSARPLGRGSYAEVFHAVHKETGEEVALKRAYVRQEAKDRTKREIQDQKRLAHPNIMPILDHDPGFAWYTMPLALGSLKELRQGSDEEELASILLTLAEALEVAHHLGLVHRDISPPNILALPGNSGAKYRWVVADWGMVRRPPGEASRPLTRTGQGIGTPGFDAPELSVDPRNATPAADVYSLGRVAAWYLTGTMPTSGVRLLPEELHWRPFVHRCTQPDVQLRAQSMSELREMLRAVLDDRDEPVLIKARRLLEGVVLGQEGSMEAFVRLVDAHQDDTDLFFDYFAQIPTGPTRTWCASDPERAALLAGVLARHLTKDSWGGRDREYVSTPLGFLQTVLQSLVRENHLGPAQDLAGDFFAADVRWRDPEQRRRSLEWLADLQAPADRALAPVLGARPDVVEYYREPGWQARSVVLSTILAGA
ncbi:MULTISPECIES: serine/threonine-protein kinase [unclassified Streptomyces]|uniref:serine/threonine-protein kinase n=1 Tax=unclassified Streptomyces TaxID=2593676 RepID=UPI000939A4BF|nr:serine/threonine-protein kinase [Streptomyces sp. TSRI0107]